MNTRYFVPLQLNVVAYIEGGILKVFQPLPSVLRREVLMKSLLTVCVLFTLLSVHVNAVMLAIML